MKFGDKLTLLRKREGLSQEELGEKLTVTRQTVSKWELGQTKPDTDKLMEISKLLNVDFNLLADDTLSMENTNNTTIEGISTDDVRPRKWLLVLLILVAIIIVIILMTKLVGDLRSKSENRDKFNIFDVFEKVDEFNDSLIDDSEELKDEVFSEFEINSFNSVYEHLYAGTNYGSSVVNMLDKVITNNKTNSDRVIRVVYGSINTIDENEIRTLKKSLDNWTEYEVIFDYDDVGFINQVTIEN